MSGMIDIIEVITIQIRKQLDNIINYNYDKHYKISWR